MGLLVHRDVPFAFHALVGGPGPLSEGPSGGTRWQKGLTETQRIIASYLSLLLSTR